MRVFSKLGGAKTELIVLVLVFVSFVAMLLLIIRVRDISAETSDQSCAAQIRRAHLLNGLDEALTTDIDACQSDYMLVDKDQLPSGSQQTAMKLLLAEQMRQCWQEWGNGKLDTFDGEGEYCHRCAYIEFKDDYGSLDDFSGYLVRTKSPSGDTYAATLTSTSSNNLQLNPGTVAYPNVPIDTSKNYAVFFYQSKTKNAKTAAEKMTGTDWSPLEKGGVAAIAGGAVIVVASGGTALAVGAVAAGVTFAYSYVHDDYYTISAIYLTPDDPNNPYVQQCQNAASVTVSP
jgi:hypothetical protein